MVVVVDDEDRENEGDFVMAADKATTDAINFMAMYGRGLICVPMTKSRLEALEIGQMVVNNTDPKETAFTVSVDAISCTTGISASERTSTILKLVDPEAVSSDFNKPGHIFPLKAKTGGVLVRAGHTEAAVDLARMAGLSEAGVICEIMNDDGTMSRVPELAVFAERHGLKFIRQLAVIPGYFLCSSAKKLILKAFNLFIENPDFKLIVVLFSGKIFDQKKSFFF